MGKQMFMSWEANELRDVIMPMITLVIVAIIYCCTYLYFNKSFLRLGRQKGQAFGIGFKYLYLLFILLSFVVCFCSIASRSITKGSVNFFIEYLGVFLIWIGMLLFLFSLKFLGKEYSPCFDSYIPTKIIIYGPYSYIRHPIYTSNLLTLLGALFISMSLILVLIFLVVLYFYFNAAILEEKDLINSNPEYKEYKKRTRMFIPYIF
jgi:protein-S-isoprenylcysteine O-methyltransferase Ste14